MIKHQLALDYELGCGWLADWVEALRAGRALARRCAGCGKTSFAPERICACGAGAGEWLTLSGEAAIECRTCGADGCFALARFDGAQTYAVVALQLMPADHARGRLLRSRGTLPRLLLGPLGASA